MNREEENEIEDWLGYQFSSWQTTADLSTNANFDFKEYKNLKEWAGTNLSQSLKFLKSKGTHIHVYSPNAKPKKFQFDRIRFDLKPPFISNSECKIRLIPFCQAGRNRSQVLRVLLEERFSSDSRVEICAPHGISLAFDPHLMKDKTFSLLESDKNKFFSSLNSSFSDKKTFGDATFEHKNFIEAFGKPKTPRIYEDIAYDTQNWEELSSGTNEEAMALRKNIYDYFTEHYYTLKTHANDEKSVYIGFGDAFHRLVGRIIQANKGKNEENFQNLVLIVIDLPDLISNPLVASGIQKYSKDSYLNFYNLLKDLLFS